MAEKMLVTQALDERDLLVKKISDKIEKAHFVDTVKNNEDRVYDARVEVKTFEKEAKATYQSIVDLIDRYQILDAKIVDSNANTMISTSYGDMSVAAAISLRGRLRGTGVYDEDAEFEGMLQNKLQREYNAKIQFIESRNQKLQLTAEDMRLSILGKERHTKDDKPLEVVEEFVKNNTTELVDPLNVEKKMEDLLTKKDTLLRELDTQIKVSNATTFIEL